MALRYVARRVGAPALRGASRSSQAGYSNGDADQKMKKMLELPLVEETNAEMETERLARIRASYQARIDAIQRARRMVKLQRRLYLGSGVAGVGLGLYMVSCIPPEVIERAKRK